MNLSKHTVFKYAIEYCEFSYKCPTDWFKLQKTEEEKVRYCHECNKQVKLCLEQAEIDAAAEIGLCIAHPVYTPEFMLKVEAYENGTGEYPFDKVEMPLGLPSRK